MKIKTKNIYEDFYENENLFDFSDYPQDSKFYDLANKKAIGKMKDEFGGEVGGKLVNLLD